MNIWDTAGRERFKSLTKSFFSGATGVVFVYDITKRDSFTGVKSWIKDFEDYGKYDRVLCGNKLDLEKKEKLILMNWKNMAWKKIEILETSAKDGTNLNESFDKLVNIIQLFIFIETIFLFGRGQWKLIGNFLERGEWANILLLSIYT